MQMMNIKPDSVRIDESSVTSRMCDQPGVVGENDSWNNNKKSMIILEHHCEECDLEYISDDQQYLA